MAWAILCWLTQNMLAVPCWLTQSGQSFTLLYGAEWPGALFCWLTQKWPGLMEPRWRSIYLEISPVSPSLNHGAYIITLGTLWSWEIHISNRTVSVSLFSKQVPTFHFETVEIAYSLLNGYFSTVLGTAYFHRQYLGFLRILSTKCTFLQPFYGFSG